MNKTELAAAVAEKAGVSKADAAKALNAFFEVVSEELAKGEAVQIIGFVILSIHQTGFDGFPLTAIL